MIRTATDPLRLIPAMRQAIHAVDANLPISEVGTMEQALTAALAARRFTLRLTGVFAAVALLLAALGIYGVLAQMVAQRRTEIGLRMALGAQTRDVLKLVLGAGLHLTLRGVALGLLAALAATRLLRGLLFGVSATDPLTFAALALLLTLVALLACWIPARRAARVDPLVALRSE